MDTTVALFFSLGIVMSPASEPATVLETTTSNKVIAQETNKTNQKIAQRHKLVKHRIAATNAWLANQRQERRNSAKKQQSIKIALNNNQLCGADWNLT